MNPRLLRYERRAVPFAYLHKRASTLINVEFDRPLATAGNRSLPPVLARQWHNRLRLPTAQLAGGVRCIRVGAGMSL